MNFFTCILLPIINFLILLQNCFVVCNFFKHSNHKYFYNFLIWKTDIICKEYLENWFYRALYTEEQNQRRVITWLKLLCQDQYVSKFGLTLSISITPHKIALSQPSCHITLGFFCLCMIFLVISCGKTCLKIYVSWKNKLFWHFSSYLRFKKNNIQ